MLSLTVSRSISKTAYVVICISPSFSKAPHAASCQLLAVFVTFQEPQPKTSGPRDQRTRGPEDQGTRGTGDQRGPEDQGLRAGSTGPKDQGASPNSRAQAEPTLGKKKPGTLYESPVINPLQSSTLSLFFFSFAFYSVLGSLKPYCSLLLLIQVKRYLETLMTQRREAGSLYHPRCDENN